MPALDIDWPSWLDSDHTPVRSKVVVLADAVPGTAYLTGQSGVLYPGGLSVQGFFQQSRGPIILGFEVSGSWQNRANARKESVITVGLGLLVSRSKGRSP